MTERARGVLLMSLVLSMTLGPAWMAGSTSVPETSVASISTDEEPEHAPEATQYTSYGSPDKRSQMGFHGMRGKKDMELSYGALPPYNPYLQYAPDMQEWSKRASLGFHGMRGKKWDEEDIVKRASMGFHGMRGKKWLDYDDAVKRASMGFHGMRGKKDQFEDLLDSELEKRAMNGFHGMRGKKLFPDETFEFVPLLDESILDREDDKRAMAGFHGMRGKKDNEVADLDLSKRATMGGFHGMRGKKDDIEDNLATGSNIEKRAMGFHGMRGKKENEYNFKRAMGFLGMRGKKADVVWAPLDDRGPDVQDLNSLLNYLTETSSNGQEAAVERTRRETPRNSKKAKSAFFGMRGKKSQFGRNEVV